MTYTVFTCLFPGIAIGLGLLLKWLMSSELKPVTRSTHQPSGAVDAPPVLAIVGAEGAKGGTVMRESRTVIEQIAGFLDARKTVYQLSTDAATIDVGFVYPTTRFLVRISVWGDVPFVSLVIQMPMVIPENRRPAVAELIARINFGLALGGFALNLSDGDLHFRLTLPLADAELTQEQFGHLLGASLWSAERYNKAFCRLLYGDDLSPAEAVAEVEMAG